MPKKINTKSFIERSNLKHGNNKYNYSLVEYQGAGIKVKIICPEHGIFEQSPHSHLRGYSCSLCSYKKQGGKRMDNVDFIKRGNKIHKNKYDYSFVEIKNSYTKVKIICNKHGEFYQKPDSHLNSKQGCPKCNTFGNVSEPKLFDVIKSNFKNEKIFSKFTPMWLKTKGNSQSLDIYFPEYNIAIEYQGVQHFKPISFFGGQKGLINMQRLDEQKLDICIKNNCKLF